MKHALLFALAALAALLLACQPQATHSAPAPVDSLLAQAWLGLDARTNPDTLNQLYAAALCTSPEGEYRTTYYRQGGALYFWQLFPFRNDDFRAVLRRRPDGSLQGSVLTGDTLRPMPPAVVQVVRDHEFQHIPYQLRQRYQAFATAPDTTLGGQRVSVLHAQSPIGQAVKLYFSQPDGRFRGFSTRDPASGSEVFVGYERWALVGGLQLVDSVRITQSLPQGPPAVYTFSFTRFNLQPTAAQKPAWVR